MNKSQNRQYDWDFDLEEEFENTLHIGDFIYHQVAADDVAFGWSSVDVQIDTPNGHGVYMTTMIAGSVG